MKKNTKKETKKCNLTNKKHTTSRKKNKRSNKSKGKKDTHIKVLEEPIEIYNKDISQNIQDDGERLIIKSINPNKLSKLPTCNKKACIMKDLKNRIDIYALQDHGQTC